MQGCDVSEWQTPGTVDLQVVDFCIIRCSHGTTEDRHWRSHFNNVVQAGKPLGLYHTGEGFTPQAEASYFHNLVGFLRPEQVHMGYWLDNEGNNPVVNGWWMDSFRSWVRLPWVGVYGNLAMFNNMGVSYKHFGINWLAMPTGTQVPPGWSIPDHILLQDGIQNGVDHDVVQAAQPYPPAWVM